VRAAFRVQRSGFRVPVRVLVRFSFGFSFFLCVLCDLCVVRRSPNPESQIPNPDAPIPNP